MDFNIVIIRITKENLDMRKQRKKVTIDITLYNLEEYNYTNRMDSKERNYKETPGSYTSIVGRIKIQYPSTFSIDVSRIN